MGFTPGDSKVWDGGLGMTKLWSCGVCMGVCGIWSSNTLSAPVKPTLVGVVDTAGVPDCPLVGGCG